MKRRNFLTVTMLASLSARLSRSNPLEAMMNATSEKPLPRRRYRDEVDLSVVGFGGIIVMGMPQRDANRVVSEAIDRGVNYFDVAPSYGGGEAEEKLGPALVPHRKNVFLACKTTARDAAGAEADLAASMRRLKTDHFDLYQFHAVTRLDEVDRIFSGGGAMEFFARARSGGKITYIGFSAHSEVAAMAMMDRFAFDSILFPFNMVCYAQGHFGPAVLERAKKQGVTRLALKMLARGPWPEGAQKNYPKAWYQPIDTVEEARKGVRFTLSEEITSAIPPGDLGLFRLAVNLASEFRPLSAEERSAILAGTEGIVPLFKS